MPIRSEPTALSLIPPAVVLTLAVFLRRPILALILSEMLDQMLDGFKTMLPAIGIVIAAFIF